MLQLAEHALEAPRVVRGVLGLRHGFERVCIYVRAQHDVVARPGVAARPPVGDGHLLSLGGLAEARLARVWEGRARRRERVRHERRRGARRVPHQTPLLLQDVALGGGVGEDAVLPLFQMF